MSWSESGFFPFYFEAQIRKESLDYKDQAVHILGRCIADESMVEIGVHLNTLSSQISCHHGQAMGENLQYCGKMKGHDPVLVVNLPYPKSEIFPLSWVYGELP